MNNFDIFEYNLKLFTCANLDKNKIFSAGKLKVYVLILLTFIVFSERFAI